MRPAMPEDVRRNVAQGLADTILRCWPEANPVDLASMGAIFTERLAERSGAPAFVMLRVAEDMKTFIRDGRDLAVRAESAARPTTPAPETVGAG
jgi:hypothetical protein